MQLFNFRQLLPGIRTDTPPVRRIGPGVDTDQEPSLGVKLRRSREAAGLTQEELARLAE